MLQEATKHPTIALRPHANRLVLRPAEDVSRFSLRLNKGAIPEATKAFGCPLPESIGHSVHKSGKTAAKLGPDEWYLLAPLDEGEVIEKRFQSFYNLFPHSLVDVSHRETGLYVEGPFAELALRSAVAFDVSAMEAGETRRTFFDRVQIILMRESRDRFRVEVWRSFAEHVWSLLRAASREISLDI